MERSSDGNLPMWKVARASTKMAKIAIQEEQSIPIRPGRWDGRRKVIKLERTGKKERG
jgi:hypothetical protein